MVDVVRLLRDRGVAASGAIDRLHEAVEASTDLLRQLGVEPDRTLPTRPVEQTPIHAAAVLLRAAGVEPSTVAVWPARSV